MENSLIDMVLQQFCLFELKFSLLKNIGRLCSEK
jgi:hypothetical protein